MNKKTAKFIKAIVGDDEIEIERPQIAFIGRSNVGKSSVINSLTNQKDLAKTSSFPGRTQQINLFLVENSHYFVDLPGYGYAKLSGTGRDRILKLINWYLFESHYEQKKVVFIFDANVGLTANDEEMLRCLQKSRKDIVIVANKVDKVKKSEYQKRLKKIQDIAYAGKIISYSSTKNIGTKELAKEIFT
jgi:GTP-binding protein